MVPRATSVESRIQSRLFPPFATQPPLSTVAELSPDVSDDVVCVGWKSWTVAMLVPNVALPVTLDKITEKFLLDSIKSFSLILILIFLGAASPLDQVKVPEVSV